MPKRLFSKHRRLWTTLLTVGVILIALAVNLLLPLLQHTFAVYPDLTPEGLYTVSSLMVKQMDAIGKSLADSDKRVTVTFCQPRDVLLANHDTRYVYILAKKLEGQYPFLEVRTVDVVHDPSSVDEFRSTRLSEIKWDDVIFSSKNEYGTQYRIYSASSFWSEEEGEYTDFNGEYKLASAILSLVAFEDAPLALFTVGHGEKYYDPDNPDHKDNGELEAFADLLTNLGLKVGTVNLETEEIPSDCVLLIMNGPTRDYDDREEGIGDFHKVSCLEKVDRYLAEYQAFMVLKDPAAGELSSLNGYLEEWGLSFRTDVVRDSSPAGALTVTAGGSLDSREYLIASYASMNEGTVGYSMYQAIADRVTAPKTVLETSSSVDMLWGDLGEKVMATNVSRMVSGLFFASSGKDDRTGLPTAGSYIGESFSMRDLSVPSPLTLAAVSVESKMGEEVDFYSAYVIAVGTTQLISSNYINNSTFCNYDVVYSMLRTVSRTDRYADKDLGGLTLNSDRYGGKDLWLDELRANTETGIFIDNDVKYQFTYRAVTDTTRAVFTVLLSVIVVAVPLVGVAVHRRRKFR